VRGNQGGQGIREEAVVGVETQIEDGFFRTWSCEIWWVERESSRRRRRRGDTRQAQMGRQRWRFGSTHLARPSCLDHSHGPHVCTMGLMHTLHSAHVAIAFSSKAPASRRSFWSSSHPSIPSQRTNCSFAFRLRPPSAQLLVARVGVSAGRPAKP